MITIRQILAAKGGQVFSVQSQANLGEAATTMAERGIGALAVHEGEVIVGLLSERDLVVCLARQGVGAATAAVASVMQPPLHIDIDADLHDGLGQMTDRRRRHLLVQDHGRVVGMVSIGDLVKAVHDEQVGTISSLHQYITG